MRLRSGRTVWFGIAMLCAMTHAQSTSTSVRSLDFKNFDYPWKQPNSFPDHLQWMSLRLQQHIHLTNGRWDGRDDAMKKEGVTFFGLTLEDVQYGHLSSETTDDAIAVLQYHSGGTQNYDWVYIYGTAPSAPKLLGFFHSGDRAYKGLDRIFIKDRVLHVILFDPELRQGDCCSEGDLDFRFRWNGLGFEALGAPLASPADRNSRLPVSVFGLPKPN